MIPAFKIILLGDSGVGKTIGAQFYKIEIEIGGRKIWVMTNFFSKGVMV